MTSCEQLLRNGICQLKPARGEPPPVFRLEQEAFTSESLHNREAWVPIGGYACHRPSGDRVHPLGEPKA